MADGGERRYGGIARLYGADALARLRAAHVAVVGVGALTLIDLDHVAESNLNRQVHALESTLGQAKVQAMAQRIAAIDPGCTVRPVEAFAEPDTVAATIPACDLVLDCIDSVRAKAALVVHCAGERLPLLVSGAGGGRTDPTRIRVADLARAAGDPLLAKLRYRLRREHGYPREAKRKFGVTAVYSDEPVRPPAAGCGPAATDFVAGLACAGYGSAVTVTAPLGFTMAAVALNALVRDRQAAA